MQVYNEAKKQRRQKTKDPGEYSSKVYHSAQRCLSPSLKNYVSKTGSFYFDEMDELFLILLIYTGLSTPCDETMRLATDSCAHRFSFALNPPGTLPTPFSQETRLTMLAFYSLFSPFSPIFAILTPISMKIMLILVSACDDDQAPLASSTPFSLLAPKYAEISTFCFGCRLLNERFCLNFSSFTPFYGVFGVFFLI